MTATSHALTGAMIATLVRQPLLAIPLAFLSHFVCDALPHFGVDMKFGDKTMRRWLLIDGSFVLSFAALLLLIGVRDPVLLAICGFTAISPDLVWFVNGLRKLPQSSERAFSKFHRAIQKYEFKLGIFVDIAWSLGIFALIMVLQ